MLRCDYEIVATNDKVVFILDMDKGNMSITNDAENVVKELYKHYPKHRYVYRDSMSQWDELLHTEARFDGFAPWVKK